MLKLKLSTTFIELMNYNHLSFHCTLQIHPRIPPFIRLKTTRNSPSHVFYLVLVRYFSASQFSRDDKTAEAISKVAESANAGATGVEAVLTLPKEVTSYKDFISYTELQNPDLGWIDSLWKCMEFCFETAQFYTGYHCCTSFFHSQAHIHI